MNVMHSAHPRQRFDRRSTSVITAAVVAMLLGRPALAGDNKVLVPGYPGCLTEELLSQFTSASVTNDERGMAYLEENGCFRSVKALPYSMIDFGFAISEVRVYLDGGEAVKLFVPTEATR